MNLGATVSLLESPTYAPSTCNSCLSTEFAISNWLWPLMAKMFLELTRILSLSSINSIEYTNPPPHTNTFPLPFRIWNFRGSCDFDEFETKDLAEGKIGDLISRLEFCSNAIIESLPNTFQSFVPVKFSTDKLLEESKGLLDVWKFGAARISKTEDPIILWNNEDLNERNLIRFDQKFSHL